KITLNLFAKVKSFTLPGFHAVQSLSGLKNKAIQGLLFSFFITLSPMPKHNLKYLILFLSLLYVTIAKAQLSKEAWHWQFGLYGCLDFSSGSPVSLYDSIDVIEGSASISD